MTASVRVALRKHNIPKKGKSYGWDDRASYDKVLSKLKQASAEGKAAFAEAAKAKKDGAKGKKAPPKPKVKAKGESAEAE